MRKIFLILFIFILSGCASTQTVKRPSTFKKDIVGVKRIAVIAPDVKVYQLTAGGYQELIDEWTDNAKDTISQALSDGLSTQYGYGVKFFDEQSLESNSAQLWKDNQALFNAVAVSARVHALDGDQAFEHKVHNFDYSLGEEIREFSKELDADALLFVYGYDHEATAGRKAIFWWNLTLSLAAGNVMLTPNPTELLMGLVDGQSGDLLWFKATQKGKEYSFEDSAQLYELVKWMLEDFKNEEP